MPEPHENCRICGRPKQSDAAGSLTQWVYLCKCDERAPKDAQVSTINICVICGKRIGTGRSGSFTQWIFRAEVCECSKPQAAKRTIRNLSDEEYAGSVLDLSDVVEIDVNRNKFPADRFAPIELLGSTYDSSVYLSIDKMLGTRVAVKCVDLHNPDNLVRFQKEVKALAKLSHSGIVKVLDFAENEGAPYMVMEYIDGVTMRNFLKVNTRLSIEETLVVARQLTNTLAYCHSKGILHRDIKPENLLVCTDTEPVEVRLVDFGLACTYETISNLSETVAGTPPYMAPDVGRGKIHDIRSEVYSLGCVLFELITGTLPYESDSPLHLLKMHAEAEIPTVASRLPGVAVDTELETIIQKCLAKDPDDRYQSMELLNKAIDDYESGVEDPQELSSSTGEEASPEEDPASMNVPEPPKTKVPYLLIVLSVFGLIAVVGYFFYSVSSDSPSVVSNETNNDSIYKPDYSTHSEIEHHTFKTGELENLQTTGPEIDNKYLKRLLRNHSPNMKEILLESSNDVDVQILSRVFGNINIENVTFAGKLCSPKYIRAVARGKKVRLVRLEGPEPKDVRAIPRNKKRLTVVVLNNAHIKRAHINQLVGIRSLNHLRFNFCSIENGVFEGIAKLPVVNLSVSSSSFVLTDLASLRERNDMKFLRVKACKLVKPGERVIEPKEEKSPQNNFATGLMELTTGKMINAPDSLLEVISGIELNRIYFENYIFSKAGLMNLCKIKRLKRLDLERCVLEMFTKQTMHELRPDIELHAKYCITTQMDKGEKGKSP